MEKNEIEIKRLTEWLKKLLPDSWDKIDVLAKYDSSLSYAENKTALREEVKALLNDVKAQVDQAKADKEKQEYDSKKELEAKKEAAEAEVMEWNKQISFEKKPEIDAYYKKVYRAVNKVCQEFSTLAFVKGRGGIGKSTHIKRALHLAGMKAGEQYVEITGEVTEAYLYRMIYENNGKILWFKDLAKLLTGMKSINLLKASTESEVERLLTKNSYSKKQEDLPDRFLCRCRFIFDYNNLTGVALRDDFEALVSRGDFVELAFQDDEMAHIMRLIADSEEKKEVTEYLIKNYESTGMFRLNLRTQYKAFNTHAFALKNRLSWEKELLQEVQNVSKTRSLLYSLMGNKAMKTTELKKKLLRHELVNTLRTADRRVMEWLFIDELFHWDDNKHDGFVGINPKPNKG